MTNRRILNTALVIGGLFFNVANAQNEPRQTQTSNQKLPSAESKAAQPSVSKEDEEKFFDDDGGRVFIVRRDNSAFDKLKHYGGKVIAEPQTYNIFLGKEWSKTKQFQLRQDSFDNLLAAPVDASERASLDRFGVPGFSISTQSFQEPYDFGKERKISDLQVHALLAEMLKRGALPQPQEKNIYIVFLPPDVHSTLGQMISGKHYLAYHNFFYADSGKVNYIVVPFEADGAQMQATARRAVIETVINSDGRGWH